MTALDDEQLSDVQGAGIGFVLDSAMVDGNKATIAINGVTNTATGQNVPITVKELYVAATGSNKGSTLAPVTLGRLNFPFKLNLAKGSVLTTQLDDGRVVSTLPATADVIEAGFPQPGERRRRPAHRWLRRCRQQLLKPGQRKGRRRHPLRLRRHFHAHRCAQPGLLRTGDGRFLPALLGRQRAQPTGWRDAPEPLRQDFRDHRPAVLARPVASAPPSRPRAPST